MTIHVIDGNVTVHEREHEHVLDTDDVLVLPAGLEHAVRSETGGVFLLTIGYTAEPVPPPSMSTTS